MTTALPYMNRQNAMNNRSNGSLSNRRASLSSFPSSRSASQMSQNSRQAGSPQLPVTDTDRTSDPSSKSKTPPSALSSQHSSLSAPRRLNADARSSRRLKSQYPRGSPDNHVEYILVASFDIDRGPVMEHQYPVAITGDENMLAELMLPDQAHARNQDWTMFFLHKDTSQEEEDAERQATERRRRIRRRRRNRAAGVVVQGDDEDGVDDEFEEDDDIDDESTDSEPEGGEGPPLIYVLNLVNTKHDKSVKRGAIVKAMAICTRHPFLHIYKPLLLLALEEYFKSPVPETLSMLYDAVNAMDLSLMPRLSILERHLLLASENRDLFVEKFEQMIQIRMAQDKADGIVGGQLEDSRSPVKSAGISRAGTKAHVEGGSQALYSVPRDTHEFESKVMYKGIPIPIKVPTAVMPETVGDFSLIKLIQNFSEPHSKSPHAFALHPHLTTNGTNTHPIIVLVNALLTQKRIIFLGHNMPSGEVAEAVLAACALASGGLLRGFTRHAFPYTDLTKIDDLLNVPGFIAGVTNPTFEMHPEWWDVLCDLPSGRIKISSRIEPAAVTEGLVYFQQQNPTLASIASGNANNSHDLTGDGAFMMDILKSIAVRHGERVIRAKWRDWVTKFTRIAAQFEESVYGASALYIGSEDQDLTPPGANGHGYVWTDDAAKNKELAGNVTRVEGWRNTRSYYSYIQDLAQVYTVRPLKGLDLAHMHDRLRMQRLSPAQSKDIYLTLSKYIHSYDEICLLLNVAPESHAGLFYLALGLFHQDRDVRLKTSELLNRVAEHEAGQHWWKGLSRFEKLAYERIRREVNLEMRAKLEKEGLGPSYERRIS
ncbi:hypothetical protein NOR_00888 [Metarhizium rileyi]|uniref:UDENN domain-containing protein n=1 Tax=Metarhizium rileyi (strain RCEF 4871) TaxID=1649241 RepID=A0A162JXF2_METRR|nr:hypothetical protein NOR_00888 [Metarhizium rileyi RCEF 4871]TWU75801.1 hypothetical protein ED733_004048 [Metarhizium rileyi]